MLSPTAAVMSLHLLWLPDKHATRSLERSRTASVLTLSVEPSVQVQWLPSASASQLSVVHCASVPPMIISRPQAIWPFSSTTALEPAAIGKIGASLMPDGGI